jgi:hypothetical protein
MFFMAGEAQHGSGSPALIPANDVGLRKKRSTQPASSNKIDHSLHMNAPKNAL